CLACQYVAKRRLEKPAAFYLQVGRAAVQKHRGFVENAFERRRVAENELAPCRGERLFAGNGRIDDERHVLQRGLGRGFAEHVDGGQVSRLGIEQHAVELVTSQQAECVA